MAIVLVIIVSLISQLNHAFAQNVCPKCGEMDVPYPLSTGENCGNPSYKIRCNNNGVLEFISADGFPYKIISINPTQSTFILSPPVIQKDTCRSSDLSVGGLRIEDNVPFNVSKLNTVMLFNCSDNILQSPLNCSATSPCKTFESKELMGRGCRPICCSFLKDSAMTSRRIRIRDGGCSAYTSVVDLKPGQPVDAWNFGIELQWFPILQPKN